ncbi:signal peptidase I [Aeromicrobium sp. 636]|uniref:Signal peptidase I n=1 Tax=Aeromicrobium senzhongii TaxID=2663859 RepID=A0A8I0ERM1_9ACTN|nr:signal peptidase I [Aeromicrobium senzhongii]MCQ3996827.1 signal peptidase I [Aeromicrobium sp. 636]MTB86759.1 signal peptidase I [Aeromicrobium senzhongii]QNL95964.1 signal peptidase I [Aeromicrobium senzhongii]
MPLWQESLLLVATALVLALIVKTFFFQAFYIPSDSMVPTMVQDDKLLVEKWSYWSGGPERGDIVVFRDPGNWLGPDVDESSNGVQRALEVVGLFPSGGHLIKRVIGVGGDRVVCCDEQGRTTVNGEPVDEPYLADQEMNADQTFDVKVPKGYLWVQGDNRGNSADSRAHLGEPGGGFIPDDDVVGKAWLRVWPLNRFGLIKDSNAFDEVP